MAEIPHYVREFASRHKVATALLKPDDQGEISLFSVYDYAKTRGDGDLQALALHAQFNLNAGRKWDEEASAAEGRTAAVSARARNPLVDLVRAACPPATLRSDAPNAPTLFASGDLPTVTASGIPPASLLHVPWQARHAVAAAPTVAQAQAIIAECSGPDAEETAAMMFGSDDANLEYRERVEQWRARSMTDAALRNDSSAVAHAEMRRREETRWTGDLSDADAAAVDSMASGNFRTDNGRVPGEWSR